MCFAGFGWVFFLVNFDFHIHTHYSRDSTINPKNVIKIAKNNGLDAIAITDHNTIKGGLEVARLNNLDDFTVLVGAEIKTSLCEITGLLLNEEISTNDPFCVIDEIKDQGGITILPHPFRNPFLSNLNTQEKIPFNIIKKIDAIEVFNARTSLVDNEKALLLATKMHKPMVAGSDAHFYPEIGNVHVKIPSFDNIDRFKENILARKTIIEKTKSSSINLYYQFLSFIYNRVRRMETTKKSFK